MKCMYNRVFVAIAQSKGPIAPWMLARRQAHRIIRRGALAIAYHLHRAIGMALIVSVLATSTPAAPQTIVALAKESNASFAFWFHSSGWRKELSRLIEGRDQNPKGQEKQRDRDAKVTRIQIFPGDVTVELGDQVRFSAIAYDRDNTPVGGVKIKWRSQNSDPGRRARVSPHGEFEATSAGSFGVVAEGANKTAAVTIVVRPGTRRNPQLTPIRVRQVSSRDLPSPVAKGTNSSNESVAQYTKTEASKTRQRALPLRAHAYRSKSPVVTTSPAVSPVPLLPDAGWDDSNDLSADDPINRVGNPPGSAMDEGSGSGNFQIGGSRTGSSWSRYRYLAGFGLQLAPLEQSRFAD